MLGDLGQFEVIGAILGGAVAAGVPAFTTARRTGQTVRLESGEHRTAHEAILGLLADLIHSVETLRDQDRDILDRLDRREGRPTDDD